jgi:hypothetical protein
MTFTYSDASISTDLAKVRLEVGDTTQNSGPRPGGSNYSDAEINYFLDQETTVGRAAARAFEVLAAEWSRYAGSLGLGPRQQAFQQAQSYRDQARIYRRLHGGAARAGASGVIRVDAFSDDVDSFEVDETSDYT